MRYMGPRILCTSIRIQLSSASGHGFNTKRSGTMASDEHSRRAAGCSDRAVHQSRSDNSFDDVIFDKEWLLPLSLVGLSHIAHETIYQDAIQYLIPPALVEMLASEEIRKWESVDIKTILKKILRLRRGGEAQSIIPLQSTEYTLENALLRYLGRARDDQLRKCVREHHRLRELDEEVAQLRRKIGLTSNDVMQTLVDGEEDNITFIDDERVSSPGQSDHELHCQEAQERARATLTVAL